jgi:hypothetical protein
MDISGSPDVRQSLVNQPSCEHTMDDALLEDRFFGKFDVHMDGIEIAGNGREGKYIRLGHRFAESRSVSNLDIFESFLDHRLSPGIKELNGTQIFADKRR